MLTDALGVCAHTTVAVFFKPAGGAAQLKVSVVKVLRTDRCDYVIKWLRKALQLKPSDALVRHLASRPVLVSPPCVSQCSPTLACTVHSLCTSTRRSSRPGTRSSPTWSRSVPGPKRNRPFPVLTCCALAFVPSFGPSACAGQCFTINGKLTLHYSPTPAWG